MKFLFSNKGQSLLEIILMIGLAAILIPGIATGLISARSGKAQEGRRVEALALVKESQEALRVIRERGWSFVSTNGTFYPTISGSTWVLTSGTENINGLTRSIEIASVNRDSNGAIVTSGGTLDPSTKHVLITVSWTSPTPSSVTSEGYITRYLDNITYTETSQATFNLGTHSGTTTTNTSDGEVTLGAGGQGSWCDPNLSIQALDLPKSSAANAVTAIEGEAFAGTGSNSSGESLVDITISNTNPPTTNIIETFDGVKTNDVFGEQDYAYVATDTNSKEVVIINIALTPFTEVGSFNASGSEDGQSVFVLGNVGYLLQDDMLWNFDLSSKTGARSAIDSNGVSLAGDGKSVYVVGNYAYIATTGDSAELQIIDVSTPSNMQIVGSANLNSGDGTDIFVNTTGTRAYVSTKASSSQGELFIIDTSAKTGSRPILGSYESNGMDTRAVEVVPGNKAILVGSGGEEYQVVNIANETTPVRCGGLEIDTAVFDSASILESDNDAYTYIVTGDSNSEFKIIEGGPGGSYSSDGTFTSRTYDIGYSVAFNRIVATINNPNQTSSSYQIGIADAVSGSCDGVTFTYVGPDGTSATSYTTSGGIPLSDDGSGYENPGRCLSYQATLHSNDGTTSPVFEDITVNYSP